MNCPLHVKERAEILLDYCSRRMDPDRAAEFRLHVADCGDCKQVVEAQESVWNALDAFEATPVSMDFDRKLWARIEAEDSESWWRRSWTRVMDGPAIGWTSFLFNWKPMLVAATACAAMAAVMMVSMPKAVAPPAPNDQKQLMERVEKALDDVDMLNQIGVIDTSNPGS